MSSVQNNLQKRTTSLQRTKCRVPMVSTIWRIHFTIMISFPSHIHTFTCREIHSSVSWYQMANAPSSYSSMRMASSSGQLARPQGGWRLRWGSMLGTGSALQAFLDHGHRRSSTLTPPATWGGVESGYSEWTRRRLLSVIVITLVSWPRISLWCLSMCTCMWESQIENEH